MSMGKPPSRLPLPPASVCLIAYLIFALIILPCRYTFEMPHDGHGAPLGAVFESAHHGTMPQVWAHDLHGEGKDGHHHLDGSACAYHPCICHVSFLDQERIVVLPVFALELRLTAEDQEVAMGFMTLPERPPRRT